MVFLSNLYRPSMFNLLIDDNADNLYIYNSYLGINGIRRIKKDTQEQAKKLLNSKRVERNGDALVEKMIECGYLIPIDYDEKCDREQLFYDYVTDTTLNLLLHTTEACNFRCKYCALNFNNTVVSDEVCDGLVNFVRKNVKRYTALHMEWFGGEPLIGIDAIEKISKQLIKICKEAQVPYFSSITTNGYLLTEENVKRLIDCRVFSFCVTIDGLKTTHDNQRVYIDGSPTWDRIISNLEYIRDNVRNRYVSCTIRGNFTKQMVNDLPEFYNTLNDKFGFDSRFSFFVRPVGDWGGDRVKQIYDNLLASNQMQDVYQYLIENQKGLKNNVNLFTLNPCGAVCRSTKKNRYIITSKGKIQKCESCSPANEIGYLKMDGTMHLDNHLAAMWTVGHRRRMHDLCDSCPLSCSCLWGTCPKNTVLTPEIRNCGYITEYKELVILAAKTYNVEII